MARHIAFERKLGWKCKSCRYSEDCKDMHIAEMGSNPEEHLKKCQHIKLEQNKRSKRYSKNRNFFFSNRDEHGLLWKTTKTCEDRETPKVIKDYPD